MYKLNTNQPETTIQCNEGYEGESIEEKIDRILNNNEPISDGAPLVYTERKDGVRPEYDVRTDRFELAVEAMDKVAQSHLAKRQEYLKVVRDEPKTSNEGGAQSTQATGTE